MKKLLLLAGLAIGFLGALAQQDAATLQETARNFMKQGDLGNAILVLNKALLQKPKDIGILKDIAYAYYLQRDFARSLETIKPVLESDEADVQSFQIAGNIYKSIEDTKECAKLYSKGLHKFPNSGALNNEYGELLWSKKDYDAIKQWEKGIEVDPNYPGNYYNACKYYYFTVDKVWSLIYGEMFMNLESYSQRAAEIKNVLLDGYKKLFSSADLLKEYDSKKKNEFEKAFLGSMNKQASLAASGIDPESLAMIRTRFILDWFENNAAKFPLRLFEYQRQLLQSGLFEAYNQWIFGAAANLPRYQIWTQTHQDAYDEFNTFQRGRVFKVQAAQYYQTKF